MGGGGGGLILSFTGQKLQCANLTQDTTTDADTFFGDNLNHGQRILESELGSFYTEETARISTTANRSVYSLPRDYVRLKNAFIDIDGIRYEMEVVQDEGEWQRYQINNSSTSDTLRRIFVRRNKFEIYPTPATSSEHVIHDMNDIKVDGVWAMTLDGTNLTIDNFEYKTDIASLNFDVDVSLDASDTAVLTNSTMSAQDLSRYDDTGLIRIWVFIPSND